MGLFGDIFKIIDKDPKPLGDCQIGKYHNGNLVGMQIAHYNDIQGNKSVGEEVKPYLLNGNIQRWM
ncbi:MAG: hypothetical protein LBM13_02960 [Candidatus Ancillula sp.]|jgi:hypothetical protein|nr:hypothetical protein [Candidatus Ancillula sp.]